MTATAAKSAPGGIAKKPPAKKHKPCQSHATNTYGPLHTVRFIYDGSNEPLCNRYVAYWLYDEKGKGLDKPKDSRHWEKTGILFPVGVGKTDSNGFLTWSDPFVGCTVVPGQNESWEVNYWRFPSPTHGVRTFKPDIPFKTAGGFPKGRKAGFFLLPLDELSQIESGDILNIAAKKGAWVGTIDRMNQQIPLACSLPEWKHRIRRSLQTLRRFQNAYAEYAKQHVEAVSQIEIMSGLLQMMARYPGKRLTYTEFSCIKELIGKTESLKKKISDRFLTNTDGSSHCGKALSKIECAANHVWSLIKNEAFVKELKRYLPYAAGNENENPPGPVLAVENGWTDIFGLLGEAYAALSKTVIGDKVYQSHIEPFFDYLASLCSDAFPDWPSNEGPLIDELKKALPNQTFSDADNPLLTLFKSASNPLDLIQTVFSPAPGFPSLFESIINAYGHHLAKGISKPNIFQAARLIRILFGLMKTLQLGKPLPTAFEYRLAQAANWGDLASGKKVLYEFTGEMLHERFGASVAGLFKGTMFLFALVCFAASITSDEKQTIKKWLQIIGSASNLVLTSIGIMLAKYEAALLFKLGTGCLGIVAGLAATIVSALDARDAFREHETAKGIIAAISAAGSLVLTIGFMIMAIGGSTSPTGIGAILALVGLIVTVVATLTLMVMSLFIKETDSIFNELREKFAESDVYSNEYANIGDIKQAYKELLDASQDMNWWLMSWRAIVPLYNFGFVVKCEESGDEDLVKTAQCIEKLIHDDSDSDSYKVVFAYLSSYKLAEKKPATDRDKSGFSDVHEWQRGTVFPERAPKANMAF